MRKSHPNDYTVIGTTMRSMMRRSTLRAVLPKLRCGLAYEVENSSEAAERLNVQSLGRLRVVQEAGAPRVRLEVHPTWADETFATGVAAELGMRLDVDEASNDVTLYLSSTGSSSSSSDGSSSSSSSSSSSEEEEEEERPLVVRFDTPEKLTDVDVSLSHGDVVVEGTKLECANSCCLSTARGDVVAKKLRSGDVALAAPGGAVTIKSVAEATTMTVYAAQRFYAKRISGEAIDVTVTGSSSSSSSSSSRAGQESGALSSSSSSAVRIDALYSPAANIRCGGTLGGAGDPARVHVDSMHGALKLRFDCSEDAAIGGSDSSDGSGSGGGGGETRATNAAGGFRESGAGAGSAVSVQRITGSVDAAATAGDVAAHFDVCGGRSFLEAGGVGATLELVVNHQTMATVDLRARTDLDIKENSCFSRTLQVPEAGAAAVDAEEEGEEAEAADEGGDGIAVRRGILLPDNARKELEHVGGAAKGKIDLAAARQFTSSTSFFGLTAASDGGNGRGDRRFSPATIPPASDEQRRNEIPHIYASAAAGRVTLESLSWMDSIKRKFEVE